MKKTLKIIGVLVLLVALIIGGLLGWVIYEQSKYASTAVPYLKQVIPELARWDIEITKRYMAPTALATTSDIDLEKLLKQFGKLGSLRSMEDPVFVGVSAGAYMSTGSFKTITYTTNAHFDAGDAFIKLTLLDMGPDLKIYKFDIKSKALLE